MAAINRNHAGWALKLWALATVFVLPFLDSPYVIGWIVIGAILGIVWKVLPEGPPPKPEKLPYHDEYAHKQVPRKGE